MELCLDSEFWSIKGILRQKNILPKSHNSDSNGVRYTSFWSEGPKNHLNWKILVSKFVPGDLTSRTLRGRRGFEGQQLFYCLMLFSLTALLKSGLCAIQLYPRSDTSSLLMEAITTKKSCLDSRRHWREIVVSERKHHFAQHIGHIRNKTTGKL